MFIFTIWVKARFVTANDCRNCWQFERTSFASPPQHKHKMKHFICILNFHVFLLLLPNNWIVDIFDCGIGIISKFEAPLGDRISLAKGEIASLKRTFISISAIEG